MSEEGRAFSANMQGGWIRPEPNASSPQPVSYGSHVVTGPMPRNMDIVCFERAQGNAGVASDVRVGSCAVVELAAQLQDAFHGQLGGGVLSADGREEVMRLSADRAKRVLLLLPDGSLPPESVLTARMVLATAAMELMATEAASSAGGKITAPMIRDVLRAQRPKLPR